MILSGFKESRMRLGWRCLLQLRSVFHKYKITCLHVSILQEQCFPLCTVPMRALLLAFLDAVQAFFERPVLLMWALS